MKKFAKKIAALLCCACFTFSVASCDVLDAFISDVNAIFDKLAVKFEETLKGVNYIIDHFNDLISPISEGGTLTETWCGSELDEDFVQPDSVVEFTAGCYEENEKGTVYTNLFRMNSMEDFDAYVQYLRGLGYDAYNENLNWTFYTVMKHANQGKLCMALRRGDLYVQLAFFDIGVEDAANAVVSIANYDLTEKSAETPADDDSGEGDEGEGGDSGEGGEEGGSGEESSGE